MRGRRWKAVGLVTGALVLALGLAAVERFAASPDAEQRDRQAAVQPAPGIAHEGLPGALLIEYRAYEPQTLAGGAMVPGGSSVMAQPLAPGTLDVVPDREAISFGRDGYPLVSPDGRRMAVASHTSGEVRIIDLASWELEASFQAERGVNAIAWSANGDLIFGARDFCREPGPEGTCPGGLLRDLWTIDVSSGAIERVAEYDFQPSTWHFDGRGRAITLALETDMCCGIGATRPPFVAVVDLDDGETIAEIEVADLLMGQPRHWLGNTDVYASYSPATVLSPDGSTLYVFDSVDHAITEVDLNAFQVTGRRDLGEPRSWFSRALDTVGSWFVSTAEAKGGPMYSRQAAMTGDGRYLVVSGTVSFPVEEPQWSGDSKQRPAGLLVIDAQTLEVVYREKEASWFGLSPDGRFLLAAGSYWDEELTEVGEHGGEVAFGVRVIDLRTLEETAHLWDGEAIWPQVISPDGRYAYVTSSGPSLLAARAQGTHCASDCHQLLSLVDLEPGVVVETRRLPQEHGVHALLPPR